MLPSLLCSVARASALGLCPWLILGLCLGSYSACALAHPRLVPSVVPVACLCFYARREPSIATAAAGSCFFGFDPALLLLFIWPSLVHGVICLFTSLTALFSF